MPSPATPPDDQDVKLLAALRAETRRYLAWAEARAREHATTPAQFQLVLAVRAHPEPAGPTVSELAETLQLRHHSVVGLVDRAEAAGLVGRFRDPVHGSRVHVQLTALGYARVDQLVQLHIDELRLLAPEMQALWGRFAPEQDNP